MEEISDNLLSAYLDGNVSADEAMQVIDTMGCNEKLREFMEMSSQIDDELSAAEQLPMQALAAQGSRNRCAMLCELFILRKHGIERSEEDWEKQARRHGWLKNEGTALFNIGRLLEQECLSTARTYHNTIDNVRQALKAGEKVIAVVDSNELMTDPCRLEAQYIHDYTHGATPNHALVINEATEDEIVYYDPTHDAEKRLPIKIFEQAWNDSACYMVTVRQRDYAAYHPHPIDLSDIELPADLEELREGIAENAHEVWAQGRKAQGWTYGPQRDDTLKQTPDMVPYSDLTDEEKSFDREMAMNTIKLLKKLGYKIVKE